MIQITPTEHISPQYLWQYFPSPGGITITEHHNIVTKHKNLLDIPLESFTDILDIAPSKTCQTTPCCSTLSTLLTSIWQMSPEYLWRYFSYWQTSFTQLCPWPSLNIPFAPLQGGSHRYSGDICPIDDTSNINRTDISRIPLTIFPFPRLNHHNGTPQYCHQT